ncbi:MAG TPA: hypothetical protein VJ249_04140 [Candidatus Bathyarchaeia archaeon]|nr:hypothetical protein [Candidatus Bathyarchaeia archaeon]
MNKEENYHVYVVEEAWDNIPKINIINDPKKMPFTKQSRDVLETKMTPQEYFECEEDKWRDNVTNSDFVELLTAKTKILYADLWPFDVPSLEFASSSFSFFQ